MANTNSGEFWTDEELTLLRKNYPKYGSNIPELLKTRSKKAIKIKASRMRIRSYFPSEKDLIEILNICKKYL